MIQESAGVIYARKRNIEAFYVSVISGVLLSYLFPEHAVPLCMFILITFLLSLESTDSYDEISEGCQGDE